MDTKNPQPQDPVTPVPQVPSTDDQQALPPQPVTPRAQTQVPASPISGGSKEHGPVGQVSEYVTPHHTEVAPDLPQEVADAGVEAVANQEQPDIPQAVKDAGVEPAKEAVPMTVTEQPIAPARPPLPTPMNYIEAKKEITGNPNNSKTWLGMLSKYVLEKFGMQKSL